MKIGILNLHMHARGGGEKKSLVLAEHLGRSHQVWLFVSEPPDPPALERYFDIDLSRVTFVTLTGGRQLLSRPPYRRGRGRWDGLMMQLAPFRQLKSFGLDIFINNSYNSELPCPAARGIYMYANQ